MTRLDELSLKLVDSDLSAAEAAELEVKLGHDARLAAAHVLLVEVEASLRGRRGNLGLAEATIAQLRAHLAGTLNERVMAEVKTGPAPQWLRRSKLSPSTTPVTSANDWLRRFLPSPRWALAGGIALLIGLGVWLFPPTNNTPTLAVAAGTRVMLEREGQSSLAQDGLKLSPGDLLQTSHTNGATLTFGTEKTRLTLTNSTELRILGWAKGKHFELRQGQLVASVARQRPFRPMILTTPNAQARVLGTKFTLTVTTNRTELHVAEGKVQLADAANTIAKPVKVPAGYYAIAAGNVKLAALPQTGGVLREWWTGVKGKTKFNLTDDPRFPDHPDRRDAALDFELAITETNGLAVRLCGYVHPPITGNYNFWLERPPVNFDAGFADLKMSRSESPAEAVPIAATGSGTLKSPYAVTGATAAPPPIPLVAGQRYYMEARMLIARGAGQLSIVWQPPGQSREVLSAKFLSPWKAK